MTQIIGCAIFPFVSTSETLIEKDIDWFTGFHLSFSLFIAFGVTLIAIKTYEYSIGLKREPCIASYYIICYLATIILILINSFIVWFKGDNGEK
jgi:hypothetical protein